MIDVPKNIRLALCAECDKVIGTLSNDIIFGEELSKHMDKKGHNNIHILTVDQPIIINILDELKAQYQVTNPVEQELEDPEREEDDDEPEEKADEHTEQEYRSYMEAVNKQERDG